MCETKFFTHWNNRLLQWLWDCGSWVHKFQVQVH